MMFDAYQRYIDRWYGTAEVPVTPNCTTCGTWAGCVCMRSPVSMTAHCYLCDAQHDIRVQAPRVCDACRRRYL
jgi:hypothetical protein